MRCDHNRLGTIAIQLYLAELRDRLGNALATRLVGVHLTGSAAVGAFRQGASDLDVLVVADGAEPSQLDAIVATCSHDASSCSDAARGDHGVEVLDSVAWAHDHLLPRMSIDRVGSVAVHPTCSTRQMGMTVKLQKLAEALADEVYVPPSAYCCGFAGDRGMLHPELTAAATAPEAAELAGRRFDAYVSSNRTCEIGLASGTGQAYRSIIQLLEAASRTGAARPG